jgi:hypothetical protein
MIDDIDIDTDTSLYAYMCINIYLPKNLYPLVHAAMPKIQAGERLLHI